MKKVFSLILFSLVFTAIAIAQGPVMTFDNNSVDYGVIDQGAEPYREFVFKNTGNEPLLIKNAKGSCGCTVPEYSKEPIMPGETGVLKVRYDTKRVGPINKTITVTTNETGNETKILYVKGEVKKGPAEEGVPPAKEKGIF
jgi:hypothetical protein